MEKKAHICGKCGKQFDAAPDENGEIVCPNCQERYITEENKNFLSPGTVIHGFEIIRQIGSGGMGTVYLANQQSMQRQVALKVLNRSVTKDSAAVEQFLKEVRNTGKLQHHNIVSSYEAGEENGIYFLAMQYINGDTLDNYLAKKGPLPEIHAVQIVIQIASALEYVWKKYNMFHRDIKPGNFMLNEDGDAMLMDMGIAQNIGDDHSDGSIEGSPYYMSPEQVQGFQLSWTTDLYSLGASLFQLITGVPPYDAKSIEEILRMHCTHELPYPNTRNPNCRMSEETFNLIRKMMARKPEDRYESWEAFLAAAGQLLNNLKDYEANPAHRPPPPVWEQIAAKEKAEKEAQLRAERRKLIKKIALISGSAVLLILILVLGIAYFVAGKANTAAAQTQIAALEKIFQTYQKEPAQKKPLEDALQNAKTAVSAIGVSGNVKKQLKALIESTRKNMTELSSAYDSFEVFIKDFSKYSAEVRQTLDSEIRKSVPGTKEVQKAEGTLTMLERALNTQKPVIGRQQEFAERAKSEIIVLKDSLDKCKAKIQQMETAKAQEKVDQNNRQMAAQKAANEKKSQAELQRAIAEKKAKEKAAAEAEAKKKAEDQKAQEANLLKKIDDCQKKICTDFIRFFAEKKFASAADYPYPAGIVLPANAPRTLQKAKKDLDAKYAFYKKTAEDAGFLWNRINGEDGSHAMKNLVVDRPFLSGRRNVAKMENGKVFFVQDGEKPILFESLDSQSRYKILDAVCGSNRMLMDKRGAFCFAFHLFSNAPALLQQEELPYLEEYELPCMEYLWKDANEKKNKELIRALKRDLKRDEFRNKPKFKKLVEQVSNK